MSRKKYRFSSAEDALLREHYDGRRESINRLARALGYPRWAVKRRARELGLSRTKESPWSQSEVDYLEAHLCRMSIHTIARKLGRSVTAVALKAKRLGIRKTDEGYTVRSLALAFGVDDHVVQRWIRQGMLRASRRNTDRERDMYYITDQAIREFVCTYPTAFDLRRVDQLWFVDLMNDGPRR